MQDLKVFFSVWLKVMKLLLLEYWDNSHNLSKDTQLSFNLAYFWEKKIFQILPPKPATGKYYFQKKTCWKVLIFLLKLFYKFLGSIGSSLVEQAESIFRAYTGDSVADDLYLIVHNVDGPMLRNEVSQGILSR